MLDPLYQWLGIPPDEQPPHHYRLLAITTFESDNEVINIAADKQLSHLQQITNGEHAAEAEDLSNQVSAARLCLLSPARKKAYDERLRHQLEAANSSELSPTVVSVVAPVLAPVIPPALGTVAASSAASSAPAQSSAQSSVQAEPVETIPVQPKLRTRNPRVVRSRGQSLNFIHYSALLALVGLLAIGVALKRGLVAIDPERAAWLGITVEPAAPADTQASAEAKNANSKNAGPKNVSGNRVTGSPQQSSVQPMTVMNPARVNEHSPPTHTPSFAEITISSDPIVNLTQPSISLPSMSHPNSAPVQKPDTLTDSVPSDDEIIAAMSLVRELYKDKYSSAKTTADRVSLADQMTADGFETDDDPVGRFAVWKVARGIYVKEGLAAPALEIIDRITDQYDGFDRANSITDTIISSSENVSGSKIAPFVSVAIDTITEMENDQHYQTAIQIAEAMADRFGDRIPRNARTELASIQERLVAGWSRLKAYQAAKQKLESTPDDPRSNQIAGTYLCLIRRHWTDGLPFLANGPESPITSTAQSEIKPDKDVTAATELADAWHDLGKQMPDAQMRDAALLHSMDWYTAAQGAASGLIRKKIDLRLDELLAMYPNQDAGEAIAISGDVGTQTPEISNSKTRTSNDSRMDFANVKSQSLDVGIGPHPDGIGQAEAGVELNSVKSLTVTGSLSHADIITVDAFTKSGFVVDYHTPGGYTRRVFLGTGMEPGRQFTTMPIWGTATVPDIITDLGRRDSYSIDLTRWAPKNWDGKVWFTLLIENAGSDRTLRATLSW
ncbi:hypothetical protein [Rubripirellula reticaptiva]|uniref:Uncharacterized protein n=1 Tax=Rubripirellula reticaptiva TaxID=2528013 RepID=A0A5C6FC36_9BACT|nr:hypothetical protein [Rubripirellula reticaptiva]TWU58177.1 hypothetical protein Poly59_10860 [Rubripirellula reticaptiva]